ncbi:hypothetical protein ABT084_05480 [Streptomyces sp. NPDC002138]|uniref:hypothetical protein n=1 Tax=Streptomyces sp. NPDC002138 TaxID=3154410 RepID=UPI003316E396
MSLPYRPYVPVSGEAVVDLATGGVLRVLVDINGTAWVRPLTGGTVTAARPTQLRRASLSEVSREWRAGGANEKAAESGSAGDT